MLRRGDSLHDRISERNLLSQWNQCLHRLRQKGLNRFV